MAGGLRRRAAVVRERPAGALLGLAEQHSARMIVVGTNAERPFLAAILGSMPLELLHRSSVPVLMVPAGPAS
ncbi:MAG: universal stress protein [Actinomycetota bacterium]|nr:universal stress protein [Actinomycetota bacterium]